MKHPRKRHTFLYIGSAFVFILYVLIEPDSHFVQGLPFGANTIVLMATLLKAIWYISLLHLARKSIFDYLDLYTLIGKAEKTPEGAGYAIIGVAVFMLAVALVIAAAVLST